MDQEIKTKIDDFLETIPKNEECVKYMIDCITKISDDLNEIEARDNLIKVKNDLIEDLLNFFDVDETPFYINEKQKTFNKLLINFIKCLQT